MGRNREILRWMGLEGEWLGTLFLLARMKVGDVVVRPALDKQTSLSPRSSHVHGHRPPVIVMPADLEFVRPMQLL